jgi:hypothetical protein
VHRGEALLGAIQEHEEVDRLHQKQRFITIKKPHRLVADSAYGIRKVLTLLDRHGIPADILPRITT